MEATKAESTSTGNTSDLEAGANGGINKPLPAIKQPSAELKTATNTAAAAKQEPPTQAPFLRIVFDDVFLTPAALSHNYSGEGTAKSPYICEFVPNDPRNPQTWTRGRKWAICLNGALITFVVSLDSSGYSGAIENLMNEFNTSTIVATLGLSLYVLGFAFGPLLWGPLSELYGRRWVLFGTYIGLTAFLGGAIGVNNMAALLVCRAFAGIFGSSAINIAGGIISDMFSPKERGLALALYASAPFMGPAIGYIVGNFTGEYAGWRWVMAVMAIVTGVAAVALFFMIPETYGPVLLERRAKALEREHGGIFRTRLQLGKKRPSPIEAFKSALLRPWVFLIREPIVLSLSVMGALNYGTLYLLFGAFPYAYQFNRGWGAGIASLPFLGVLVGMLFGIVYIILDSIHRYSKHDAAAKKRGDMSAPPESRLPVAMVGAICLPIGLFWFAWTNGPEIHWIVSVIATVPFGFGMVLVFLSISNYLIDTYTIYAASVLASNSILRSVFAAVFPLFTPYMYQNLGIHWASTVPAFLALACVPLPFLFWRYGEVIRKRCKYSRQAAEMMAKLMAKRPA